MINTTHHQYTYHLIQIHGFQQVIELVDQKDLTKVQVRSQLDLSRSKKYEMEASNKSDWKRIRNTAVAPS